MMEAIRKRYAMVPYVYTESRKAYDTGVSLCRPMYYGYPEEPNAYKAKGQYMFGSQLLVAPVVSKSDDLTGLASVKVWLPEGEWFDTARGCTEAGGGWIKREYLLNEVPVFVRPGTMIPQQQHVRRLNAPSIKDLLITIYPGKTGEYVLYEDDGITTGYENDDCAHINMHHQTKGGKKSITIEPVTGNYKGFAATKTIEIHLPGSVPPKAIRFGRESLDWSYRAKDNAWWYDGDAATVCIRLTAVDLRKGVALTIDEGTGKPANGIKAILARLEQLRILSIVAAPDGDRIGIEMAQMGNRVSRNPDTLQAEWIKLCKQLPQAEIMFKTIKKENARGKACETRSRSCDKALAMIKHLVKSGLIPEYD
jgi:alpha-glucosidase